MSANADRPDPIRAGPASTSRRAIILGGTGAIGGATAARLAASGWQIDVTGRDPGAMPVELSAAGVRFHDLARDDLAGIGRLIGSGADLLVDVVAFRAADVRALLPMLRDVAGAVIISGRAVYVDSAGRNINGASAPMFVVPISESTPTLAPAADDVDPFTREGYGPSKAAVEQVALDSGLPITVIRPSKVHGRRARQPRTRDLVERMLSGEPVIEIAAGGRNIDHLTAAANTAALIETVAARPASRVLNSADPDTPNAAAIIRAIGDRVGWSGELRLLGDEATDLGRGRHPWQAEYPIVLDTAACEAFGYRPVGTALDLLTEEVDWCAGQISGDYRSAKENVVVDPAVFRGGFSTILRSTAPTSTQEILDDIRRDHEP